MLKFIHIKSSINIYGLRKIELPIRILNQIKFSPFYTMFFISALIMYIKTFVIG